MGVVLAACFIIVVSGIVHLLLKHLQLRRNLKNVPSVRSLPFLGHILIVKPDPEGFVNQVMGLGELNPHGPRMQMIWIGPKPAVMLYSAETIEPIVTSSKHLNKGFAYDLLHPWLGLSLLTSEAEQWRPKRKLLTQTFHYDILKDFQPVFNEQSRVLCDKISRLNGAAVEVSSLVTLCTLDIICETSMGRSVNAQQDSDSAYVHAIYTINDCVQRRSTNPLWWLDLIYYSRFGEGKLHDECLAVLHGFTKKVIDERRAELEACEWQLDGRLAFLDLLLEMAHNGHIPLEDIQPEVDTFMFEGHDTTSTSLTWTLHLLSNHPDVVAKCQREIDEVMGDSENVQPEDLAQLKYLEMVIKESLRIYPSVPMIMRELGDDQKIGEHVIPKGTHIVLNQYLTHRDPKHWSNPEKFDPDRFLPENASKRHSFAFMPFSIGSRNCIGQRFALMEEKTVLCWLLRNFNIVPTVPSHEVRCKIELIIRPIGGIHLKFEKRTRAQ